MTFSSDSSSRRRLPDRFLVAFSFAGEQRELVCAIAEAVEQRLGIGTVFYDEWFEADLAGFAADLKLQKTYSENSEAIVFCPSKEYDEKRWAITEWDAIRARHIKLRADRDPNAIDRILPLRVADGDVEGLLDNTIWVDARQRTAKYVADLIVHRLRKFLPHAGKRQVFLAETTFDFDDESKPVNRPRLKAFLEGECDFEVLPGAAITDLPSDQYRHALEEEMRRSLAFIQMLSPYPWKGGGFDQIQYKAAERFHRPMYRFRGEINLDQVEKSHPTHRQFLEANGAIAGGFEDFKLHIQEKLKVLANEDLRTIRRFQESERKSRKGSGSSDDEGDQPLVRVAIRAKHTNELWAAVFQFLYQQEKVLLDAIEPNESFAEKQDTEPCHGFLILCDENAQTDDSFSLRNTLAECRLIQTSLKNSACIPPVGIIYWPPPDAIWSKLIKSIPKSLHKTLGDSLEAGLQDFLNQVRQVRRALP